MRKRQPETLYQLRRDLTVKTALIGVAAAAVIGLIVVGAVVLR
jgi:hypothetical protein